MEGSDFLYLPSVGFGIVGHVNSKWQYRTEVFANADLKKKCRIEFEAFRLENWVL